MLPYFTQEMDADISSTEALPATALGTEGSREPGPGAMRTTESTVNAVRSYARRVARAREYPPFPA